MAEDGVLFENAYSQSTHTPMSLPSFLTASPPHHVGIDLWQVEERLSLEANMVTEVLGDNYTTVAGVGQEPLFTAKGILQGFDYRYELEWSAGGGEGPESATYFDRLENVSSPFLLFHFIRAQAHEPYDPPSKYRQWSNFSNETLEFLTQRLRKLRWDGIKNRPGEVAKLVDLYDGEILEADAKIGRLIKRLKKQGRYNNTLIVVTSDHGEGLGDHNILHHNAEPWDELVHVPLIVKFPKNLFAGKRVEKPVRHLDVVPTIYDYLGIENANAGISLRKVLSGERKDFPIYTARRKTLDWAIYGERYKYILPDPVNVCLNGETSEGLLFDLKEDPNEKNNLSVAEPAKRLRQELCQVYRKGEIGEYVRNDTAGQPRIKDEEIEENLRALGYIK